MTIGTFDGVHRGHCHLLAKVRARANQLGGNSLVVTFEPNPLQLFSPERFKGRLTTPRQKLALIGANGIDRALVLPFTHELAGQTAETFMVRLVTADHPVEMWIGSDFALGKGRKGDFSRLKDIGTPLGLSVHSVDRVDFDGVSVSSSEIRTLVAEGNVEEAQRLLGHPFVIEGEVIPGSQVGRTIGYPTANVALPESQVIPADGIYVVYARIGDESLDRPAMTYIGTRPALNTGSRLIETHLIDFDGDLYGQRLSTSFVTQLRPDSDFVSVEALIAQLQQDEANTRSFLSLPEREDGSPASGSSVQLKQ